MYRSSLKTYLDENGLRYLVQRIKTLLNNKADKTEITRVENIANGKASAKHTHTLTEIKGGTTNRVPSFDSNGVLTSSSISSYELEALNGIEISKTIQEQLNQKSDISHTHEEFKISEETLRAFREIGFVDNDNPPHTGGEAEVS